MAATMVLGFLRKAAPLSSAQGMLRRSRDHVTLSSPSFRLLSSPSFRLLSQQFTSSWSAAAGASESQSPASLSSPLLMLPPLGNYKVVNYRFFNPLNNEVVNLMNQRLPDEIAGARCKGSSRGWLAYVNRHDCGIYLTNIFCPSPSPQIVPLPSVETLEPVLRFERDPCGGLNNHYFVYNRYNNMVFKQTPDALSDHVVRRFAMSHGTVMISHNQAHALAFCRIGDQSWTPLEQPKHGCFTEIVYSEKDKLFYASCTGGYIEGLDLSNPSSPKRIEFDVHYPARECSPAEDEATNMLRRRKFYLVESPGGEMLLVERIYVSTTKDGRFADHEVYDNVIDLPHKTAWFNVFRIDFKKLTAKPLEDNYLRETVLFVGLGESFSVSARDYPGLRPNSIYFDDHLYDEYFLENCSYGGHDVGIFNLEDNKVLPLHNSLEFSKVEPPPLWVFPRSGSGS